MARSFSINIHWVQSQMKHGSMSIMGMIIVGIQLCSLMATGCQQSQTTGDLVVTTYSSALTATIFIVGENRFPFTIFALDGLPLNNVEVVVRFSEDGTRTEIERIATSYEISNVNPHYHRDGVVHIHNDAMNLYVVEKVYFPKPGVWSAHLEVSTNDKVKLEVSNLLFRVLEISDFPMVGDMATPSKNPTLNTVEDPSELSTRIPPAAMHAYSIATALEEDRPLVIIFSTPALCVSRQCGPVLETAITLQRTYKNDVIFIHIEPYDLGAAKTEGRLVMSTTALEWALPSEPWTYVIGPNGLITDRYEGMISSVELDTSIKEALSDRQ